MPFSSVAEVTSASPAVSSPVLFCIVKQRAYQRLETTEDFECLQRVIETHGFDILWRMDPVFFQRDFWLHHYFDSIERKEASYEGSGMRYAEKVLLSLENTWGIPCVLRNRHTEEHIKRLKQQLRQDLAAALHCPESENTANLLHLSDDIACAVRELENFGDYLRGSGAAYEPLSSDEQHKYRAYINDNILPAIDVKLLPTMRELAVRFTESGGTSAAASDEDLTEPYLERIPPLNGPHVLLPSVMSHSPRELAELSAHVAHAHGGATESPYPSSPTSSSPPSSSA